MEYFTLQGSCLISILIPINLAVGDYTLWFQSNCGIWYKRLVDILLLIFGGGFSIYFLKKDIDPYVSFIFFGGIVVAIIQNSIHIRNKTIRIEYNNMLDFLGVVLGGIIIMLPHTDTFYKLFLSNMCSEVVWLCLTIYFLWGTEKIIFHCINLYKRFIGSVKEDVI